MGVHLLAILGLAALCGLWVALQIVLGEKAHGAQGECGACSHKRDCDS